MADVLIIGDGPAGLSAALFLAKKKKSVIVFGQDKTPMHDALLYNYLGIPQITGSEFQKVARKQVADQGGRIIDGQVTSLSKGGAGFAVRTADGAAHEGKYVIIASGPNPALAEDVGLKLGPKKTIEADRNGRTSVDRAYVVGWSARPDKIQAIISAGDGAAAALDILSAEAGKDIHDFDVAEKK